MANQTPYELKSLKLPRLSGASLKLFTAAVENPVTRALLLGGLLENGGIPKLRRLRLEEAPTLYPLVPPTAPSSNSAVSFSPGALLEGFPFPTARQYTWAYQSDQTTPLQVAKQALAAIEASDQGPAPLRAFIAVKPDDVLEQARAATERYRHGQALGPLDGVPVAIKDEFDMTPYPTTVGTRFLGREPAQRDATAVARLRAAGALLLGKTNMHEIGINPDGSNPHYGVTRNPYDDRCDSGGSSSGPAASVAAGLAPIAMGADGGGSIRIPAALCGVVGLKPTFGRVSEAGAAPLGWSVGHIGPLSACVEDTALAYAIIAGPDRLEPLSQAQPPVTLEGWNKPDVEGLRLGIYPAWFEHAAAAIVEANYALLEQFKRAGAQVIEIAIPELDEMRIAHAVTILSEMAMNMLPYKKQRRLMGCDARLSLVLGETFSASDYLQAQRIRTRALAIFRRVYEQVDVIVSPATALTAQPIPPSGEKGGWSDLGTVTEMMRFIFVGNLAGLPAISFPAGYDEDGRPIGMQAMGRWWEEHVLLRLAYNAERVVERRLPGRFYPALAG